MSNGKGKYLYPAIRPTLHWLACLQRLAGIYLLR
jgi:hypothetical protein